MADWRPTKQWKQDFGILMNILWPSISEARTPSTPETLAHSPRRGGRSLADGCLCVQHAFAAATLLQAIEFDPVDEDHARFCRAAAILRAESCGIAKLPSWHTTLNTVTPRTVRIFSKGGNGMFWWVA